MAIVDSTIREDVWNTLRDGLGTFIGTTTTIIAAYPDTSRSSFDDFIVLNPINVENEQIVLTKDRKNRSITANLDIYSKKNITIDQLSDKIEDYFITEEASLSAEGLEFINSVDGDSGEIEDINNNKYHVKSIAAFFDRFG